MSPPSCPAAAAAAAAGCALPPLAAAGGPTGLFASSVENPERDGAQFRCQPAVLLLTSLQAKSINRSGVFGEKQESGPSISLL